MSRVSVRSIRKVYGSVIALDNVGFEVGDGQFISLLGPSGCGKTTTLRVIAGLIEPDSGRIEVDGRDIVNDPPERRNMGVVFQSYALFPHKTILENVAFGLKMRKTPTADIPRLAQAALDLVRLSSIGDRYPRQISGGQQQRVAIARAIATRPSVLLLDEPLSNLDLKLRMQMRVELKELQRQVGITTIFVTHDQEEGLMLSDRVVVMSEGRVAQEGTPDQIYETPVSSFVADFIGEASLFEGRIVDTDGANCTLRSAAGTLLRGILRGGTGSVGTQARLILRPEKVRIGGEADGENHFTAQVEHLAYAGATTRVVLRLNAQERINANCVKPDFSIGDRVKVSWPAADSPIFID